MQLIEVAFRGNRKEFFGWEGEILPPVHTPVIVEADRGEDLGTVHAVGDLAAKRNAGCAHGCGEPVRKALRVASKRDVRQGEALQQANDDARVRAADKVRAASLQMKISDAEWQWDRKKLTLYFTAEKRVDFRNLVRDLAASFRTRIELKQIGVRDEAKRLDGIGRCGRQYCSAAWLPELRPVNLGVAKDQRLSLNPSQISGACGRLMCCLRFEHEFYVETRRRFPKEGRIVTTMAGEEKILAVDLFRETVTLRTAEGAPRSISLESFNAEVEGLPVPAPTVNEEDTYYPGEEISPELMYTSEFAVPQPRLVILTETVEAESAASAPAAAPGEARAQATAATSPVPAARRPERRRRSRRGGEGSHNSGPSKPGDDTGPAKGA